MRILTGLMAVAIATLATPALSQTGLGANGMDTKFVTMAIHIDNMEIDGARAELRASSNPSVHLYANTIIKDHTASSSQLAAIAQSLNISYPDSHVQANSPDSTGTPPPGANAPAMPSAQSPQAYFQNQVQGHNEAILLYQNEANNGGSAQLRRFAADALPTLKAHLAMAQQYLSSGTISPEATPTPAGS
jgi:putative membrane protein